MIDRSNAIKLSLDYLSTEMFNPLHNLLEVSQFYIIREEEVDASPEMVKYIVKMDTLSLILQEVFHAILTCWE